MLRNGIFGSLHGSACVAAGFGIRTTRFRCPMAALLKSGIVKGSERRRCRENTVATTRDCECNRTRWATTHPSAAPTGSHVPISPPANDAFEKMNASRHPAFSATPQVIFSRRRHGTYFAPYNSDRRRAHLPRFVRSQVEIGTAFCRILWNSNFFVTAFFLSQVLRRLSVAITETTSSHHGGVS